MKWMKAALLATTLAVLVGCAAGAGTLTVSARSANYTEDYIEIYSLETPAGKDTGLFGVQVQPFSEGGKGKGTCCGVIPHVGQPVRVIWRIGNGEQAKTYHRDVLITGSMPKATDGYIAVIVRFFPEHQVEVELAPQTADLRAPNNPRIDELFYGRRVMRQMGE